MPFQHSQQLAQTLVPGGGGGGVWEQGKKNTTICHHGLVNVSCYLQFIHRRARLTANIVQEEELKGTVFFELRTARLEDCLMNTKRDVKCMPNCDSRTV
jgi:hypothetical protein